MPRFWSLITRGKKVCSGCNRRDGEGGGLQDIGRKRNRRYGAVRGIRKMGRGIRSEKERARARERDREREELGDERKGGTGLSRDGQARV